MIGWLRTHVRKQPIIVLYFEFENELKFYNLEARIYERQSEIKPTKCKWRRIKSTWQQLILIQSLQFNQKIFEKN